MPVTSAVYEPRGVQTIPRLSDFKYNLPDKLIAQTPLDKRDQSRMLVVDRETKEIRDEMFSDIVNYLNKGDVVVVNSTVMHRFA